MTEELEKVNDDILFKIGRNVILFQKIEKNLKLILSNNYISGPISEIPKLKKEKESFVHKQTMGMLINDFVNNTVNSRPEEQDPDDINEPHLRIAFTIETDNTRFEERKILLSELLKERNNLVHHLLSEFNLSSIEDCIKLNKKLDIQYDNGVAELRLLNSHLSAFSEAQKTFANLLQYDEFINLLLNPAANSAFINALITISKEHSRCDGWTDLRIAGKILNETMQDLVNTLKRNSGQKTLAKLIKSTNLFAILQEPLSNGNNITFYKPIDSMGLKMFCE